MCKEKECKIRPNYNKEGESTALYCSSHKLDKMVNVKDKTCIHLGCTIIPTFNKGGETKALYCAHHKLDGMADIKNKTCIYSDINYWVNPANMTNKTIETIQLFYDM